MLLELELVEPSLFFAHGDRAAERLAAAVARRLDHEGAPPGQTIGGPVTPEATPVHVAA